MKKEKDKVYKVEIKPKWELNFAAKFYLVCIIVFVLLVAYIQIYRHIHRDEIIQNIIERENKVVVENEIRNTNEETQIINEKEILSVYGEEQSLAFLD